MTDQRRPNLFESESGRQRPPCGVRESGRCPPSPTLPRTSSAGAGVVGGGAIAIGTGADYLAALLPHLCGAAQFRRYHGIVANDRRDTAMTRLHAYLLGDTAVLPRAEFEELVELARRSTEITVDIDEDGPLAAGILQLAAEGGAFTWLAQEPDLYSVDDLQVCYR